jgi:ribosomal protein S18 acetylase RimI-like enzyme
VEGPQRLAVEDALVQRASAWLRGSGARLAQTLLPPTDAPQAEPLLRNGFRHVTRLWYMLHPAPENVPALDGRLTYESYARLPEPALLARVLQRTYEATQDCPEVTGVRTMDEVIEGHRAQGKYDPERWWLVRHGGEPIGVLLLTEMPEWASLDVAYVGVVPGARGRGFGRAIMGWALREAALSGIGRVTLSVDARNEPAWRLYRRLGFEAQDEREVYLALWGAAPGPTTTGAAP